MSVYGRARTGKSTLLRIAAGCEAPVSGSVELNGRDLSSMSPARRARWIRQHVGWMDRDRPASGDLSARVYVALPLYRDLGPREAERQAVAALARVGARDVAGYAWGELTDTDRSLVAIAQALVRSPALLVADDPAAGLGIVDRERVVGLLRSAAEDDGLAVLMAVPDMPAMLHAHEVRLLSRGRLISPRSPAQSAAILDFPSRRQER